MPQRHIDSERAPQWRPQLHRRDVLRGGAYAAAGLGAASLLAACGGDEADTTGSGDYPLARPDSPVTLPIFDDNQPIESGLEPEKADTLRVLNYADYMAPGVMKDFQEKYGAEVQVTPYNNYDEMLTKISAPGAEFDVVFPGPSVMSRMVYGKLLQPLQLSYMTNLKNTWPEYQDPWYDQGSQYSVPYVVYTTGVGYRSDLVTDPSEGYKMLWNPEYAGKMGVLDDAGEALGMAMLAWDITQDINTADPELINAAKDKLKELIPLGVKVDITQYETEKLIDIYKPDIFCAGIKEKYAIQKKGIPMKQLHSYDSGGPYAGFKGAVNFYREIDRMVNSKVWKYLKAPWQKSPELTATYACE